VFTVIGGVLVSSCGRNPEQTGESKVNSKYQIEVKPVVDSSMSQGKWITELVFRVDGKAFTYGKSSEGALFDEVFSPNSEWVLLPQGIWGLVFCKSADLEMSLKNPNRFNRIETSGDHAVVFRFVKWVGPNSFELSLTFSGEEQLFTVDLESQTSMPPARHEDFKLVFVNGSDLNR
jgi:hypothetical protein